MRTETRLFLGSTAFFVLLGGAYWLTSYEVTGFTLLLAGLAAAGLLAGYLAVQARRSGLRPEDRPDAAMAEGAGRVGHFPSGGIWPPLLAVGALVTANGLLFGIWPAVGGAAIMLIAIAGQAAQR